MESIASQKLFSVGMNNILWDRTCKLKIICVIFTENRQLICKNDKKEVAYGSSEL